MSKMSERRRMLEASIQKELYIYKAGYSSFKNCSPEIHSNAAITWEDSRVKMNMANLGSTPYVALLTDFTPYKKLVIEGYASGAASDIVAQNCGFGYGSVPTYETEEMEASNAFRTDVGRAVYTFDISNVSGNKYINFRLTVGCAVWIYDIHLE